MNRVLNLLMIAALLVVIAVPAAVAIDENGRPIADVYLGSTSIAFDPLFEAESYVLRVVAPCETVLERTVDGSKSLEFDIRELEGETDGEWQWELRRNPIVSSDVREQLRRARIENDRSIVLNLKSKGMLPEGPFVQAASFLVQNGSIVSQEGVEKSARGSSEARAPEQSISTGLDATGPAGIDNITDEQVISGDLVVYNSICVGFDCPNNPSFGADTIRLQENNLRIHFEDTSTAASFPSTDWRLEANSNANGGGSYFAIQDASANRNVFLVEANAPSNSLRVDNGGRVGMGTGNPVTEIHSANGDSPTLRLEQTTASGFAAQTWDMAGNETNFFVRDATNGSTLPFRIRPGAPSNSIFIDTGDGNVGMGTASPSESLHVRRTNGNAAMLVEEASGTTANRILAEIRNNGPVTFQYTNTAAGADDWGLNNLNGGFAISVVGSGVNEALIQPDGDMIIQGTLTENSDRNSKRFIEEVTPREVLDRLTEVPIATWNRNTDDPAIRHMGPMAQDFAAVFGLGINDTSISSLDMAGVSMAAVQGLYDVVEEDSQAKQAELDRLKAENQELRERLERLEALLLDQE